MKRVSATVVAGIALLTAPIRAQERLGSGAPTPSYGAGWTVTPTMAVAETYDTNVSLFGAGHTGTEDYIATYNPGIDLHYLAKHTSVDTGYSGTFLDYRNFPALNRWDQRGRFELRHQQSAQLTWTGHATAAVVPTTDLLEVGGIPYRHTGAKTVDGRGGVEYALSARDAVSSSLNYQDITFDRPEDNGAILRGGRIFESTTTFRHKLNSRLAMGADYSYRKARVTGDPEPFVFHTSQAAVDYQLSPQWSLRAAGGLVFLQETLLTPGRVGPAWRAALEHGHAGTTFHVGYVRTFIPSFGFGGTVESQDVGVGFRTPLFHVRRLYFDSSAVFRDTQPLNGAIVDPVSGAVEQLPLRSLRMHTILGWEPQPWMRLEAFVSVVQQTSLRAGGYIDRNRLGFQVVTYKPMRMQ